MRKGSVPWILLLIVVILSACAGPGSIRHVGSMDSDPLLFILESRETLAEGLTATIHMDFEGEDRHFKGKAYLLVSHPGRFRLEVPGWLGSTLLLMASDGQHIWAYYPEDAKAYRTTRDGLSLSPYLPFPFPLNTATLPHILLGSLPREEGKTASAYETTSGGAVLYLRDPERGVTRYLFRRSRKGTLYLSETTLESRSGRYVTTFDKRPPHHPLRFTFVSAESTLRVKLDQVHFRTTMDESPFRSPVPPGIFVKDLESYR
ncbi:MAG: hypothetical protein JSV26_09600 [bacterium]|nr:MAG: hypothetical protein JSV26_09600 [bacterium]